MDDNTESSWGLLFFFFIHYFVGDGNTLGFTQIGGSYVCYKLHAFDLSFWYQNIFICVKSLYLEAKVPAWPFLH